LRPMMHHGQETSETKSIVIGLVIVAPGIGRDAAQYRAELGDGQCLNPTKARFEHDVKGRFLPKNDKTYIVYR